MLEVLPGTRNRKVVRLTEEGRRYDENIVGQIYQEERHSLEKMLEEEWQMCITLLDKYIKSLKDEVYEK